MEINNLSLSQLAEQCRRCRYSSKCSVLQFWCKISWYAKIRLCSMLCSTNGYLHKYQVWLDDWLQRDIERDGDIWPWFICVCVVSRRWSLMISTASCAVWSLKCMMFTTLMMRRTTVTSLSSSSHSSSSHSSSHSSSSSSHSSTVVKSLDDDLAAGLTVYGLDCLCLAANDRSYVTSY